MAGSAKEDGSAGRWEAVLDGRPIRPRSLHCVPDQLEGHEGECASPMFRRRDVGRLSRFVWDHHSHVEVNKDEVVLSASHLVHDVVDAHVAVEDVCLVS